MSQLGHERRTRRNHFPSAALSITDGLLRRNILLLRARALNRLRDSGGCGLVLSAVPWEEIVGSERGALAVLRFRNSSNLVGCSMGISPGFAPRRNLVDKLGITPEQAGEIWPVRHEAPTLYKAPIIEDGGHAVIERKCDNRLSVGPNESVAHNKQGMHWVLGR
jgi:hypothetical protein